jgi:hypothetical protein
MTKARKYSRKGIPSSPKTLRKFTSAVNKLLWRKYQLVRADVGIDTDVLASAFQNGIAAQTVVEDAVAQS